MRINIAANYEEGFIDKISRYKEVTTIFGKLASDYIGGGIETSKLSEISLDYLRDYINLAASKNISFNYILNAPVLGNNEFTAEGRQRVHELLELLDSLELESVTVANLYLIHYIRKNFSNIPVKTSATMMIDSVDKAKYMERLGVKILVLDPMLVNRDLKMLKAIRKAVSCDIELIINNNCISRCPYLYYHQCYLGFNSRNVGQHVPFDFCYTNCSKLRVLDPLYWIKSDWIRPEDIGYYEEIGIDRFKIIDRATPVDELVKRIEAYIKKSFDGNFLDLILHYGYKDSIKPEEYLSNIYIDNRKLDGFMSPFLKGDCDSLNCGVECTHCHRYAENAISINDDFRQRVLAIKDQELRKQTESCA